METFVSTVQSSKGKVQSGQIKKPISLSSIATKKTERISTGISELNRALGGGLVGGQVILLAGEPGIGKSTLLLQVLENLPNSLYVSGEESAQQIALRAGRLGIKNKNIAILEETDIDSVVETAKSTLSHKSDISALIVDSIQTMYTQDLSGLAGSVGQVRESAQRIVRFAKSNHVPVFIVGHVTKEGTVAGPSTLAHIVDTVLWFEGDKADSLRLIRAVKNRFGPTDEVGIFKMDEKGLVPVEDSAKIFLSETKKGVSGSVVTCLMEGTRPILVEIQSLVVATRLAFPRRVSQGIDAKRIEVILAVLTRRCGLPLWEYDVFVNVAGGIVVREPAADLAVALSIASSFFDKPAPAGTMAVGEIGLLGELRPVGNLEKRIKQAQRVGYKTIISGKEFKYLNEAIKKYFKI